MKGTVQEGYFTCRVLYMKGTLHEGYFTWRVLYMKGTLHVGYCTWRVLYMKVTVYEGYFTWRVLYMNGTLHEGYCTRRVLYMKGTLHEGYCTWRLLYMKGTVHEGYFTWRVLYMKGTLNEGYFKWRVLYMNTNTRFSSYLAQFFLEWDTFQTEVVEKIKTQTIFNNPFPENLSVYDRMLGNISERDRPQMTIWRMCVSCCIPNATNTHSEHVIFIAFPLQQWLHELAFMLRYTYIACLV